MAIRIVTAALLVADGRILVARRPDSDALAGRVGTNLSRP